MTVKDLFDKEFLFEDKKSDERKMMKIFYKFDINLIKNNGEQEQNTQANVAPAPAPEVSAATPAPSQEANAQIPATTPEVSAATPEAAPAIDFNNIQPSVVTEDDEKEEVTDDKSIVRKMQGEVLLRKEEIDNIQTVEDIIEKLKNTKENGISILDELSYELLQNMSQTSQMQQELKDKINMKDSSIFAEMIYGRKKEESVGIRIIKRKSSDLITNNMLVDNQIVNSQFDKKKLDNKIVDMRNEEYSDEK